MLRCLARSVAIRCCNRLVTSALVDGSEPLRRRRRHHLFYIATCLSNLKVFPSTRVPIALHSSMDVRSAVQPFVPSNFNVPSQMIHATGTRIQKRPVARISSVPRHLFLCLMIGMSLGVPRGRDDSPSGLLRERIGAMLPRSVYGSACSLYPSILLNHESHEPQINVCHG